MPLIREVCNRLTEAHVTATAPVDSLEHLLEARLLREAFQLAREVLPEGLPALGSSPLQLGVNVVGDSILPSVQESAVAVPLGEPDEQPGRRSCDRRLATTPPSILWALPEGTD